MNRIVRSLPLLSILACGIALAQSARAQTGLLNAKYEPIARGVERAIVQTRTSDDAPLMNTWIYRSTNWRGNSPRPCVLIASSGSIGVTGMRLSDDDVTEHLPFVEAGCVVVAYDTDGAFEAENTPDQYPAAMKRFMAADGGVKNARAALQIAKAVEMRIDEDRLVTVGHGAAANLALLIAAREPRIRAVVAFSPISDLVEQLSPAMIEGLEQSAPGFRDFVTSTQPTAIADQIKCPTLLFHATDDPIVPIEQTHALVDAMKTAGNEPHLVEPPVGGNVRPMLEQGLATAATWIAELALRPPTTKPAD